MLKIPHPILSAKDPGETITVGIGFSRRLAASVTIVSCTFQVSVWEGTDPDTSTMLQGTADLTGTPVMRHEIKGGLDGVDYLVEAHVVLSTGQPRVGAVILPVRKGGS